MSGDLRQTLREGVLAFPATPFTTDLTLDAATLERHVADLAAAKPIALVPAGGAGELFSLSLAEHAAIVQATVRNAGGVPVIAGAGFNTAIAIEQARAAEKAGAAAILLLPPYLITPDQAGLAAYAEAVCRATGIGVLIYSRDNGVFAPETAARLAERCPNLVGLKDGTGDFEALSVLRRDLGERLVLINGVPTAEILARQCFAIGMRAYSSAVFAFLPSLALRFFRAVRDREDTTADDIMQRFYLPLVKLRQKRRGYAVAIVKAGLRAVGKPAGPVRPPLVDLTATEEEELRRLIGAIAQEVPA
ncbi:MAG TPA: 5-dehydro-4-deoxyglucarate dehydratase [Bauldia sp.]|nr:5-dehydro-4-deoxyglucarate dehydratase [Bauldia sp.]